MFTSLSICATTFLLAVGLHNFENIPPQLFLQSITFIHFMNAGNLILSLFIFHRLSHILIVLGPRWIWKALELQGENVEDILWRKQCAVNCVNTPGALWLSSIYGTSRPRRETREDHHENIFIFGSIAKSFCMILLFGELFSLFFGRWVFLVVRKFDHRPKWGSYISILAAAPPFNL